jgi:hypothetical protein
MIRQYLMVFFIFFSSNSLGDTLSVSELIIKSNKEGERPLLSLAYKRCSGLSFFLSVKFSQSNLQEAAVNHQKSADLFSLMAAQEDASFEHQRGLENNSKSILERQNELIEGQITRIGLFYANRSNENYIKNGSIINGDKLIESDFRMCQEIIKEASKLNK